MVFCKVKLNCYLETEKNIKWKSFGNTRKGKETIHSWPSLAFFRKILLIFHPNAWRMLSNRIFGVTYWGHEMQCNARHRHSRQWSHPGQSEASEDLAWPIRAEVNTPRNMNCSEPHKARWENQAKLKRNHSCKLWPRNSAYKMDIMSWEINL